VSVGVARRRKERGRKQEKAHLVPFRKSLDLLDCRKFSRLRRPHETDVACATSGSNLSVCPSLNDREENEGDEREEKTHRSSPFPNSPRSSTPPSAYAPSSPVRPRPPSLSSSSTPSRRPPEEVHLELLDESEEGSGTSLAAEGSRMRGRRVEETGRSYRRRSEWRKGGKREEEANGGDDDHGLLRGQERVDVSRR
jgi:hypothetical protein